MIDDIEAFARFAWVGGDRLKRAAFGDDVCTPHVVISGRGNP